MVSRYVPPVIGSQLIRFVFDQRATARCFLARILWLQGFPDQCHRRGRRHCRGGVAARGGAFALSGSGSGRGALFRCLSAIWTNWNVMWKRCWDYLGEGTPWISGARGAAVSKRRVLLIRRGDAAGGLPLLRAALMRTSAISNTACTTWCFSASSRKLQAAPGTSRRGWRQLTKRSSAPNATRSDGTFRNFCESGAILALRGGNAAFRRRKAEKWQCRSARPGLESKKDAILGNSRTTSKAFAACGGSRVAQARRTKPNSRRFLIDSKKDSEPRTCARPKSFSAASHDLLRHHCGLFRGRTVADRRGQSLQAPLLLPQRGSEREPRPRWLPDERRTCISRFLAAMPLVAAKR